MTNKYRPSVMLVCKPMVVEQAKQLQENNREKDRQIKKMSQELLRKKETLAETAALLVLRKIGQCDQGLRLQYSYYTD